MAEDISGERVKVPIGVWICWAVVLTTVSLGVGAIALRAHPNRWLFLQTAILAVTLLVLTLYTEFTRRMYEQIKRQADTSLIQANAAILSADAIVAQNKQYKLSVASEWVLKLDERWDSTPFLLNRAKAVKLLATGQRSDQLDNIWDFFDTIGLFTRRGVLDDEMVWSIFFYWINAYWQVSEALLIEARREFPKQWLDFEHLYSLVSKREEQSNPNSTGLRLSNADVEKFLEQEASLKYLPL